MAAAVECFACKKDVYSHERLYLNSEVFHRGCAKCSVCQTVLSNTNFAVGGSRWYCKPHFKQTFIESGGKYPGQNEKLVKKPTWKETLAKLAEEHASKSSSASISKSTSVNNDHSKPLNVNTNRLNTSKSNASNETLFLKTVPTSSSTTPNKTVVTNNSYDNNNKQNGTSSIRSSSTTTTTKAVNLIAIPTTSSSPTTRTVSMNNNTNAKSTKSLCTANPKPMTNKDNNNNFNFNFNNGVTSTSVPSNRAIKTTSTGTSAIIRSNATKRTENEGDEEEESQWLARMKSVLQHQLDFIQTKMNQLDEYAKKTLVSIRESLSTIKSMDGLKALQQKLDELIKLVSNQSSSILAKLPKMSFQLQSKPVKKTPPVLLKYETQRKMYLQ